MINILWKALLAGFGIAIIAGPIGSLIIWQRMAYFGDALAHASLLGVSIATICSINLYYGLIITCILIAVTLKIISDKQTLTNDTILAILSHAILAIGLIAAALIKDPAINLLDYLFGDILSITTADLVWIAITDIIVLSSLAILWNKLVFITINKDLASVAGIAVYKLRWLFILLIALVFAVTIRLIGVLLINALLIIPCATAKTWANSPRQMAIIGSILGCIAIIGGMVSSTLWDVPTGPAIVASAALMFGLSMLLASLKQCSKNPCKY